MMKFSEGARYLGMNYPAFLAAVKRGDYLVRTLPNGKKRVIAEDLDRVSEPEILVPVTNRKGEVMIFEDGMTALVSVSEKKRILTETRKAV